MKKIKLITTALIGISALGLSGCGHQHTFDSKWESNKDEHWHPATCEHAGQVVSEQGKHTDNNGDGKCDVCDRVLTSHEHSFSADWKSDDNKHWKECSCGAKSEEADHVDSNVDGKCDICGHDVKVPEPVPAVTKVSVALKASSLFEGESTKASANVTAVNGASKDVTWSSSDPTIATVDAEGNVLALKEGTAKIIATSVFDSTKKGEATLTVKVDQGFDPSWIDEGFTYSKEFPVDIVKEFLGEGEYDIVVPSEMLEGGAYYLEVEADAEGPACVVVIIDGALDESYEYDLFDEGFDRVYATSYGYEAVDPTGKYTVSFYCEYDEDGYEKVAPTYIEFYKSEDVWDSPNKTSDTAWNLERIINDDSSEIAIASEWVEKVPFVALGEDYSIEYIVDDSEYYYYIDILMMFGFTEEEAIEYMLEEGYTKEALTYYYLSVYDYSICEPFEGYDDVLLNAGFAHIEYEDEYGDVYDYYEKADGLISYIVSFGFTESGNTIYFEEGIATLEAFPVNEANAFIKDVLGSENSIIAYEETEGASFQAVIGDEEMDILVDYVDLTEAQAYADKLEGLGFEVEYTPASDEYYPSWVATKGKLVVEFYLEQFADEDTESYLDEGPLYFFIYADPNKHEEQGIYLPESLNTNVKVGSVTLDPELVKLGDSVNLTWTSSDEGVATVDADGVVTLLAAGEVNITVTTDVAIPEVGGFYSATTKLVVAEKPDFAPVLADLNDALAYYGGTEVLSADELPEIDCAEYEFEDYFLYYGCYVIWGDGTNETEASYAEKVAGLGFEVLEDDEGYQYYETEEYVVYFSLIDGEEEPDYFQIEVYFREVAGEGTTFDFSEITNPESCEIDGFKYTTAVGTNSNKQAPQYNSNAKELRLYIGNTITFTSEEPITSIFFDANTCGEEKANGTLSCNVGKISEVDGGFYWEGEATSITFTVNSGKQVHINLIDINGGGSGGGGGGGETSDLAAFADEVSEVIFGEAGCLEYDSDYDEYWCAYYSEQSTLMDACKEICDLLAEVYDQYQAPTAGSDEDGDYVDACYGEGDYEIYVVTYEDDGDIVFQIEVYESWY